MLLLLFTKCYPSLANSNEFLIVKWWYGFLLTLKSHPSSYIFYKSIPFSSWSPEAYLLFWQLIIWLVWNKTICYFAFGFLPFCGNLNYNFSFTYSNSLIRFFVSPGKSSLRKKLHFRLSHVDPVYLQTSIYLLFIEKMFIFCRLSSFKLRESLQII